MKRVKQLLYAGLVYLFLYLPILVVVLFSFNNASHSLVWQGFTLKWYQALLQNQALLTVAGHSLFLAFCAASGATIIGSIIAISLFRYRFFGRHLIHTIIFILILTPEIVIAISLLLLFNFFKIPLGFWTLLLSHIALTIPFVTITVYSRATTLDRVILEAAMDLGASDFIVLRKIILPLLQPAILAGWLLSFTFSLDDVIVSYFVTGPTFDILPLKIYAMVRLGVKPEVNALCTLLLIFTLFMVMISYQRILKRGANAEI